MDVWNQTEEYPQEKLADDISDIMILRAKFGYGLNYDYNIHLSQRFRDKSIYKVWCYIKEIQESKEDHP